MLGEGLIAAPFPLFFRCRSIVSKQLVCNSVSDLRKQCAEGAVLREWGLPEWGLRKQCAEGVSAEGAVCFRSSPKVDSW